MHVITDTLFQKLLRILDYVDAQPKDIEEDFDNQVEEVLLDLCCVGLEGTVYSVAVYEENENDLHLKHVVAYSEVEAAIKVVKSLGYDMSEDREADIDNLAYLQEVFHEVLEINVLAL